MSSHEDVLLTLQDSELRAIAAPYAVDRYLSSGSYGSVCAGIDNITHTPVAVKRICGTTVDGRQVHILGDPFLAKRVIREVKLLSHFHHPNILGLRDIFLVPASQELIQSGMDRGGTQPRLYLVTELMRTDLAQVISDRRIQITPQHIRYYMYYMLLGLRALHLASVVHRDLHPGNILVSEDNDIKICDFNLAREDNEDTEKTHYVTHRWYRAPELVMQWRGFTKSVDIWSAGCIMGELFNRKALFRGSTFFNQLNRIVEVVGTPNDDDVAHFSSESARSYLRSSLANVPKKPWPAVIPSADPIALDLISKLLEFNPNRRLTAEQALRHPYFAELFDEEDLNENLSETPFHFQADSHAPLDALHSLLDEEVRRFNDRRAQRIAAAAQGGTAGVDRPVAPAGSMEGHLPRTASTVSLAD